MNFLQNLKRNKIFISAFVLAFIIILSSLILVFKPEFRRGLFDKLSFNKKEVWLNVFVHGTFGSAIGLINAVQVMQDKVRGTTYKKIVTKMRKNEHFYLSQIILEKGLRKVEPTFDYVSNLNSKLITYPVLKAYDILQSSANNFKEDKQIYYTFGWSGLISQERRRKEAIRFYNELSEEISKYQKLGIYPKIRIVAHSHGGNLTLNLAAVDKVLSVGLENDYSSISNENEKESLKAMGVEVNSLLDKNKVAHFRGQKKLDYKPFRKNIVVDELIMLGTPIQPETERFVFYKMFEKVYNVYSQEDVVQEMDFVSTKKGFSEQRIREDESSLNKTANKVKQIKLMVGHDQVKKDAENKKKKAVFLATNDDSSVEESGNIWSKILSKNPFSNNKVSSDPTHKQLWFVSWNKAKSNPEKILEFLPSVIFVPFILKSLDTACTDVSDVDINLILTEKKLKMFFFKHNNKKSIYKASLSRTIIDDIKSKFGQWMPGEKFKAEEFNITKDILHNIQY